MIIFATILLVVLLLLLVNRFLKQPANPVNNNNINVDTNSQNPDIIHYRLDDPTTPLMIDVPIPKGIPNMPFRVLGYIGGGHPVDSLEGQAAGCFVTVTNAIKFIQSLLTKPFKGWAATSALVVTPRAGRDLNAYYDRRGLRFFYMPDVVLGKTVYAADASDVVAHELGHATLDSLKPDLWNLQNIETSAFHEAYGDMNAMITKLAYKEVIDYVLNETGGNLRKSNIVSKLAKELGTALFDLAHYGKRGVLRDAVNSFVYVDPTTLSQEGPDDQLIGECHSFGRLFMGAWYDMFVGIYELECKTNSPADAVATARDTAAKYILAGMTQAPITTKFYNSVGRTMLSWGQMNSKPEYNAIIRKVLEDRKILAPEITMLGDVDFKDVDVAPEDRILHLSATKKAIKRSKIEKLTLSSELGLSAQGSNPLFNAEIEIPRDSYLEFENDKLVSKIEDSRDHAIESARLSLVRLHAKGLVGAEEKCEFELRQEGEKQVLVRTKFID